MRPYVFNESLPYLLARIGVQLGERFSTRIEPKGLTLQMYRVLASLKQKPEQTLGELSDVVSIEVSTLSRLVGQMVKAGMLTRTRPEDNARIVQIALTKEGDATLSELIPIAMEIEDLIAAGIEAEKLAVFREVLDQVRKNVKRL